MDPFSPKDKKWYQRTPEEALEALGSKTEGLSAADASSRLAQYGPNALGGEDSTSVFKVFPTGLSKSRQPASPR